MTALFEFGMALLFLAAVIYILFFRKDQFTRYAERPSCFGSEPGPQQRAENDCHHCSHQIACLLPAPDDAL